MRRVAVLVLAVLLAACNGQPYPEGKIELGNGAVDRPYYIVEVEGMTCLVATTEGGGLSCDWSEYKGTR